MFTQKKDRRIILITIMTATLILQIMTSSSLKAGELSGINPATVDTRITPLTIFFEGFDKPFSSYPHLQDVLGHVVYYPEDWRCQSWAQEYLAKRSYQCWTISQGAGGDKYIDSTSSPRYLWLTRDFDPITGGFSLEFQIATIGSAAQNIIEFRVVDEKTRGYGAQIVFDVPWWKNGLIRYNGSDELKTYLPLEGGRGKDALPALKGIDKRTEIKLSLDKKGKIILFCDGEKILETTEATFQNFSRLEFTNFMPGGRFLLDNILLNRIE